MTQALADRGSAGPAEASACSGSTALVLLIARRLACRGRSASGTSFSQQWRGIPSARGCAAWGASPRTQPNSSLLHRRSEHIAIARHRVDRQLVGTRSAASTLNVARARVGERALPQRGPHHAWARRPARARTLALSDLTLGLPEPGLTIEPGSHATTSDVDHGSHAALSERGAISAGACLWYGSM